MVKGLHSEQQPKKGKKKIHSCTYQLNGQQQGATGMLEDKPISS